MLLQTIVTGILMGGLYGLFSSGLSMIFGITRVVNFAHGDFVTLGMYAAILAVSLWGINPIIALVPVAVLMFVVGGLIYWAIIRRTLTQKVIRSDDAHNGQMVITLALSIFLQNLLLTLFSPDSRSIQNFYQGTVKLGGLYLNEAQLLAFVMALVCFGVLYALLRFTEFGRAIKAVVDDAPMATMVGINTQLMYATTFAIGVSLAAMAGVILAIYYPATPVVGSSFIIIAFVTVVLGGLGNIVGAFLAGIIIGVVQQFTATYVAIDIQNIGVFIVFILMLLFRPNGLMGRRVAS